MSSGFITIDLKGVDGVVQMLQSLPAELVSQRGGPVLTALKAGAKVIRDEARTNVQRIVAEPNVAGPPYSGKGSLKRAIRITRARRMPGGEKGERVLVWLGKVKRTYVRNRRNVRLGRAGASYLADPPQFYGVFLERGTQRMRPHEWMRPAYLSKRRQAIEVTTAQLATLVRQISAKAVAANRVMR